MMETSNGLLVMHYGTPASLEEIPAYYTHIRRGRAPSDEQLKDLTDRYLAIGGPSPLRAISERQANSIREGLERRGLKANLYIGQKHASPFILDAVAQMAQDGIERAVALVLAPHFSTFSVAEYRKYAFGARDELAQSMKIDLIERWGTLPALIDALARRVSAASEDLDLDKTLVLFTAHSLPERIVQAGDPYREELMETSRLVAEKASLPNWKFAFQSSSQTGEPWLGPDILDVIDENAGRYQAIVACTVGFVSEHLEVLYDLGIEARERCAERQVEFRLAETIGDDPHVMDALAGLCLERFEHL
jgi:ferrochelatase